MIVPAYHIPYKLGQTFCVKPIADVHWGNKYCDARAFKKYLANSDENTYFVGIGDLYDSIILSDFRYEKHCDSSTREDYVDEWVETMYDIVKPYSKQIIGLGIGNHEKVLLKKTGTNPVNRLVGIINSRYLGYAGMIKLLFREPNGRGRTVIVRYHHGWGAGGRTRGASLNKYSRDVVLYDADLFFYGHDHQKQTDEIIRMGLVGNKLIPKPKKYAVCGTFLKTLSDTVESPYSEEHGYPPVAIGGISAMIRPSREWVDMWFDEAA